MSTEPTYIRYPSMNRLLTLLPLLLLLLLSKSSIVNGYCCNKEIAVPYPSMASSIKTYTAFRTTPIYRNNNLNGELG